MFEPLEPRVVLNVGPLVISEFLTINDGILADEDAEFSDWIEIHNPTEDPVELDGWYLTDDAADPTRWQFPDGAGTIGPGDYLIVFASGKDRTDPAAGLPLHTNFKLDSGGEYLGLVQGDGQTVADEFLPEFPEQYADISYGVIRETSSFYVPDGAEVTYTVPTSDGAALETSWTAADFDDSAWTGFAQASRVLITEAGTRTPDWAEIQNVSDKAVDTFGWAVVANIGTEGINAVHPTHWQLPDSIGPEEVLYATDAADDNYWGENISWKTVGNGWLMIVDDQGHVADFVIWGYDASEVASLNVEIQGQQITIEDIWSGTAVPANTNSDNTLQRSGDSDHDNASDWAFVEPPWKGEPNPELITPFSTDVATGIGYSVPASALDDVIQIDVQQAMQGVNASLWTRFPFEVEDPATLDTLQLRMKYNDGFVAYINGQEVARRNAPEVPQWNSAAVAARSVADSLVYEEIDISPFIDAVGTGTNVLAVHVLGVDAADDDVLVVPDLSGTRTRYFDIPTPGEANVVEGFLGYTEPATISVDHGFFEAPFEVEITTETPGGTIRYTLDGSRPTEENSIEYTGPLTIGSTTVLRAAAFRPGHEVLDVDTETYLFLNDVIRQSANGQAPAGWPSGNVGGQSLVYGMDPDVVNHAVWGPQMKDALSSIPTMSIVTDVDNLVGSRNGIYTHASSDGYAWERPTSLEMIYPEDAAGTGFPDGPGEGFQIDAGLRIRGGYSRSGNNPKHAFRLFFRGEYGSSKLEYPLFGEEGVDEFDKFDLRTSQNYSWAFGGPNNNTMIREVFSRDVQGAMGHPYTRSRYYHLYLNGQYWGIYQTQERAEARYAASYLGGDSEDYDAIKQDDNREIFATDGNTDAYNRLWQMTIDGFQDDADYYRAQGMNVDGTRNPDYERLLDVDNLIDYMIITYYTGDRDGPGSRYTTPRVNNYKAVYSREDPDGWKFFEHDSEHSLGTGENNMVSPLVSSDTRRREQRYFNAHWLHEQMSANEEYVMRFADRMHEVFHNDGLLSDESAIAFVDARAVQIDTAIIAESARWGDTKTNPPKTRNDWLVDVNEIRTFIRGRTETVIDQVKVQGWYPETEAPLLNRHGGKVDPGFDVWMTVNEGTVYYTLDGSDPRLRGGGISPGAQVFDPGNTAILVTAPTLVKARTWDGGEWSALTAAQFTVGEAASIENLVISELNYNPYDPTAEELQIDDGLQSNDFEFVELKNVGSQEIDLTGVRFTEGIEFDFTGSDVDVLGPGELVVIAENLAAFQSRYGNDVAVAGQYRGSLDNGGEQILLADAAGETILDFKYGDGNSWPGRADGKGAALELIEPEAVPSTEAQRTDYLEEGGHWRSSYEFGGTPGGQSAGPMGVLINEVLTHTDLPQFDSIELVNTTGQPIDVGGWYLSDTWGWESSEDNGNYKKYRIDDGTMIEAHGYLVFDENQFNAAAGLDPQDHPNDFALNGAHGEDVWLMKADAAGNLTHFADHVKFGAAINGESFGRWPDGQGELVPMRSLSLGEGNSGPRVGPVVISEIHYNPGTGSDASELEFIEIYNPTVQPIDLTEWRIRGGIDFDFDAETMIAARDTLVILPFDPTDPDNSARWSAFSAEYGLDENEQAGFVGGYSGNLNNSGERVELQRPDEPPAQEPDFIPRLLEDEVNYQVVAPWPVLAEGSGHSIERLGVDLWENDPQSWVAAVPTPGAVAQSQAATVAGRFVFYNHSAFDAASDDNAIAADKEALMPGEKATFANYTSYVRGINGVMVDVAGLADVAEVSASGDFQFRTGNNDNPLGWTAAGDPIGVTVREGAGVGGSDRITIIWDDSAISGQWLQVTVRATQRTGLAEDDVFYFGNAIGEAGNSDLNAIVNVTDEVAARNFQHGPTNMATIDDPYDYNRDRLVNATDRAIARANQTGPIDALRLITAEASDAMFEQSEDEGSDRVETLFDELL